MDPNLFQIKICGLTEPGTVEAIGAAGVDAIGLNFYPPSPRCVGLELARRIVSATPSRLQTVGVFVNQSPTQIQSIVEPLALDWVQLHGDEPPELLRSLSGMPVLKAFRLRDTTVAPVIDYLERCDKLNCSPQAILLDAYDPKQFGGTGHALDWEHLSEMMVNLGDIPWVLAGGLHATNVATAIRQAKPHAVDTASGVESAPGSKDLQEVRLFAHSARSAFDGLKR